MVEERGEGGGEREDGKEGRGGFGDERKGRREGYYI